jgi:hypothetical protein
MAQTKRKRKTKHRGNAAGMIEVRGRTGRRPTESERKSAAKQTGAERRLERMNQPPTWRSAVVRAVFATAFFAVALLLLFRNPVGGTIAISAFVFVMYIPLGYYTDLWMYKRRMRNQAAARAKAKGGR